MLSYAQYTPSNTLANYIECYWIYKAPFASMPAIERLIPGGRIEIIVNLGNPMQFVMPGNLSNGKVVIDTHIMGQRNQIYYTKQHGNTDLIGVRFKPGGIAAFTRLPAAELLNQLLPAEYVFGNALKDWKERMREKISDSDKIHLLDQLIIQIFKGITTDWAPCNKIVDIVRKGGPIPINDLCNENESYYKKMERSFLKYVGYTPKHYYRIVRFNRALRYMTSKKSLTSICYDCDYYDQSHFIKDFRQFTGTTPKHFLAETNTISGFLIKHQTV